LGAIFRVIRDVTKGHTPSARKKLSVLFEIAASWYCLMLSSQTYTKTELLMILRTAIGTGPKADASLILADQLIAAKLNIANGADGRQ
jgi:hypothetical protein